MASQPPLSKPSSRWGSFLQQAVAGVESKLDTILADGDDVARRNAKGSPIATSESRPEQPGLKPAMTALPISAASGLEKSRLQTIASLSLVVDSPLIPGQIFREPPRTARP